MLSGRHIKDCYLVILNKSTWITQLWSSWSLWAENVFSFSFMGFMSVSQLSHSHLIYMIDESSLQTKQSKERWSNEKDKRKKKTRRLFHGVCGQHKQSINALWDLIQFNSHWWQWLKYMHCWQFRAYHDNKQPQCFLVSFLVPVEQKHIFCPLPLIM